MAQLITMSAQELSRYEVIKKLIAKQINGTEAAAQLRLSVRQVKRLKAKVKQSGHQGIIHGNRGRESNRKIPEEIIEKAKDFLRKRYADFKPTFAAEKLAENHGIKLSKEKTRQIMVEEKLWQPKPRKKNGEYRQWRPRKEHLGELIQFDGSYHPWFENRAPACCLLGGIDDATGKITGSKFVTDEGVIPVFSFWREYVKQHGKPLKIYLDRFSTYKINTKSLLDDTESLTQFERAMKDLNIEITHANSPQAKGRVERLFGTLQDRLVKESRLLKISTITEANVFLEKIFIPKFNQKFGVQPSKKVNFHRSLTAVDQKNLDKIFSIQSKRIINNDFTIRYVGRWFQLASSQPALVCRKDKVLIEERIDGKIFISLRNKYLNFQELPKRPEKIKMKVVALANTQPNWKPPLNHPWRQPFIFNQPKVIQVLKVNQV